MPNINSIIAIANLNNQEGGIATVYARTILEEMNIPYSPNSVNNCGNQTIPRTDSKKKTITNKVYPNPVRPCTTYKVLMFVLK